MKCDIKFGFLKTPNFKIEMMSTINKESKSPERQSIHPGTLLVTNKVCTSKLSPVKPLLEFRLRLQIAMNY